MDMIDQIGGWRSVGGIGAGYGQGYSGVQVSRWLRLVSISLVHCNSTFNQVSS